MGGSEGMGKGTWSRILGSADAKSMKMSRGRGEGSSQMVTF